MGNIANENPDHLQLKQLLEEATPLMLPMFPDQQKVWVEESPLARRSSRFSRSTLNITTRSVPRSETFSLNQKPVHQRRAAEAASAVLERWFRTISPSLAPASPRTPIAIGIKVATSESFFLTFAPHAIAPPEI
jgi:hypothetical protein